MIWENTWDAAGGGIRKRTQRRKGDASRCAAELLLQFGITPHLSGFEPLTEGVRMTAERERRSMRPPIRDLEPAMRDLCGECRPEHAMRDAIGAGFAGTNEVFARVFPFSDRPGSAEFICTLAELVSDRITES